MTRQLARALFLLALVPACGGDDDSGHLLDGGDDGSAVFAQATGPELMRALQAASGGDALSAMALGTLFSQRDEPDGCPAIASEGAVTTVTGGCTGTEGERIVGTLVLENVPSLAPDPDIDPSRPRRARADGFSLAGDDGVLALDGEVEVEPDRRIATNALRFEVGGASATSDVSWTCDDTGLCAAEPGSAVELELGTATVEGSRRLEDPKAGSVVLRGADAVTFDVAAATDDCVPYTLSDGTSDQACEDDG